MSTPFVNNNNGRRSHIMHLHNLLENPLCVTNEELLQCDFSENNILQVVTAEKLSQTGGCKCARIEVNQGIVHKNQKHIVALMLTSGSTGNAKAVCLTQAQMVTAVAAKTAALPVRSPSAILNWIGLDHVAGLIEGHLSAIFAGVDQIHVQAGELMIDPLRFLHLLSKHNICRTFAPNFFLARLRSAVQRNTDEFDLAHLRYIVSGGEANNTELCDGISELLQPFGAPRNVIVPGFGMTETCAGAIYNRKCPDYDKHVDVEFASVGKCIPGIKMRIGPVRELKDSSASSDSNESVRARHSGASRTDCILRVFQQSESNFKRFHR